MMMKMTSIKESSMILMSGNTLFIFSRPSVRLVTGIQKLSLSVSVFENIFRKQGTFSGIHFVTRHVQMLRLQLQSFITCDSMIKVGMRQYLYYKTLNPALFKLVFKIYFLN